MAGLSNRSRSTRGALMAAALITLSVSCADEMHDEGPDAAVAPEGALGLTCDERTEDQLNLASRVFLPVIPVQPPAFPAGPGFYTGIVIQNPGPVQAGVQIIFHDASSFFQTYSYDYSIDAGEIQIVIPHTLAGFPSVFLGSAEIVSSQPVHAVVNLPNMPSGGVGISGGAAQAQYRGVPFDSAATSLSFPLVRHRLDGKDTALVIQNMGPDETLFTAIFRCDDGGTYTHLDEVWAREMVVIRLQDVPGLPAANEPRACATTINALSSVPLAGVSLEYPIVAGTSNPVIPAVTLRAANAFAPDDHASRIHFPIVKRLWAGKTTTHRVQNTSPATQTVRITYAASSTCPIQGTSYHDVSIAPGASVAVDDFPNLPTPCLTTATAEAILPSSASLAGVASEECHGICAMQATTYDAIPDHQLTSKLVAPMFKEDLGGKRTGMVLYNPSPTASAVTVTFTRSTGAIHTCTTSSIGAWQYLVLMDLSVSSACTWGAGGALPDGTVSSVSAVAVNASARLAGILNEVALDGSGDAANYEAVNVPR